MSRIAYIASSGGLLGQVMNTGATIKLKIGRGQLSNKMCNHRTDINPD